MAWQSLSPKESARSVHARVAALPENLRRAALAWLRPEAELAADLAGSGDGPSEVGALRGLPYLLKDLFDLAAVPTNAGSTFLNQARGTPTKDSPLVRRLHEVGAACAGKTHLVEFAAGLFGDNSHYGDCPHPRDPTRVAGGSSSGSAALVAAGVVPFAIGTDTGGSVRVPAAFCGVYGLRLSPGDQFIRDAVPLSPSLDTAGWFTTNVEDLLTVWNALGFGPAVRIGNSRDEAKSNAEPRGAFVPAAAFGIAFEEATATACDRSAAAFADPADRATTEALFASWQGAINAYTVTALHDAHVVHRDWLDPYRQQYEPSIWQRFRDGGSYSSEQLATAAATVARVRHAFREFFQTYDYLVLPATPFPALRKSDCTPEARTALLTLTTPASLAGLPVITVPVSLPSGLTTGLQIIVPAAQSPAIPWILNQPPPPGPGDLTARRGATSAALR